MTQQVVLTEAPDCQSSVLMWCKEVFDSHGLSSGLHLDTVTHAHAHTDKYIHRDK